jgi:hypothetical protein
MPQHLVLAWLHWKHVMPAVAGGVVVVADYETGLAGALNERAAPSFVRSDQPGQQSGPHLLTLWRPLPVFIGASAGTSPPPLAALLGPARRCAGLALPRLSHLEGLWGLHARHRTRAPPTPTARGSSRKQEAVMLMTRQRRSRVYAGKQGATVQCPSTMVRCASNAVCVWIRRGGSV